MKRDNKSWIRAWMTATIISGELLGSSLAGTFLGFFLYQLFPAAEWLILVFGLTGFAFGVWQVFRYVNRTNSSNEK